jgi:hypothetical protein
LEDWHKNVLYKLCQHNALFVRIFISFWLEELDQTFVCVVTPFKRDQLNSKHKII